MTSRKEFLKYAALYSAALALPGFANANAKSRYKLGIQLYSVRESMEKDLRGTLKQIAGFGYQEAETYGFNYGNNKYYWGLEPKQAKSLLDEVNLTTSSGHYDLDKFFQKGQSSALAKYVDECIEGANTLKQKYIVWPWLAPEYRTIDEFKRLSTTLNIIGEQIKKGGLQLAYHNHDFEFINLNGQLGFDILLQETDPSLVKLELDIYWATYRSPYTIHDLFMKQPGRFVVWHLKDMDLKNHDLHTPVGDGTIDFQAIFKDAALSGVTNMFVEQGNNYVPDALSCMKKSAAYVKRHLLDL
ncbi:sugar phosphate isomerase/epimerase [Flavihumibacter sp. R14]|nr:sugar phosphate isomerase/epimerase [Flavihumibacter soli]